MSEIERIIEEQLSFYDSGGLVEDSLVLAAKAIEQYVQEEKLKLVSGLEKKCRQIVIKARIEEISNCAIGEIGQDFSERIAELKEELK